MKVFLDEAGNTGCVINYCDIVNWVLKARFFMIVAAGIGLNQRVSKNSPDSKRKREREII